MTSSEKEFLDNLTREITDIKSRLPNGEIALIIKSLNDVKEDLSELKYILLNPENGVIVKTNKNTEFREEEVKRKEIQLELINSLKEDIKSLRDWKQTVSKVLWIIFMTLAGLSANVLTSILG